MRYETLRTWCNGGNWPGSGCLAGLSTRFNIDLHWLLTGKKLTPDSEYTFSDLAVKEFPPIIRRIVEDANVAAEQKNFDILISILEWAIKRLMEKKEGLKPIACAAKQPISSCWTTTGDL